MSSYLKNTLFIGVAIIIITLFVLRVSKDDLPDNGTSVTALYACNDQKTIHATLYDVSASQPMQAGEPPVPTGSAVVVLSDGRTLTLARTLSADGVRYANPDESFVFWNKGNGALVLENNVEKSYTGCVMVKPDTGGLGNIYQNGAEGVSMRYPAGYQVDESYVYYGPNAGDEIHGIKFTIPSSSATGTNLGEDSYISIETIPGASACSAPLFIYPGVAISTVTDDDTEYSFASSTNAAAGNRYEEYVYALPGTNPCVAVRYLIHYGVFENYDPGTVKQFDKIAILDVFDAIRRSLVVNQ